MTGASQSNNMISRRQIILGQEEPKLKATGGSIIHQSNSSGASSSAGSRSSQASEKQILKHQQQARSAKFSVQQQILAGHNNPRRGDKMLSKGMQSNKAPTTKARQLSNNADDLEDEIDDLDGQQDSSDGYVMNQYDYEQYNDQIDSRYWRPEARDSTNVGNNNKQRQQRDQMRALASGQEAQLHQDNENSLTYRHFDPYSIYSEDEDTWYSEERLFEDHLDEIFNKWQLLDDDIWCKLIIMERNRRIGKAYARVPIVTIDGSHELSYDGYKLALNGFENPDRDPKTEECRKRIGKGIRIKMDSYGNILIKRLSKSSVYIKEWLNPVRLNVSDPQADNCHMPSRKQLIKNQTALLMSKQPVANSNSSSPSSSAVSSSSSSGGSSMEQSNESALCDEVISIGGRLELDKIYVMFDMKKFQANITQELCRPYPDKRKLEQQCFSIVALARDSTEILDLPCWVMVINIVAIQMLNQRFPSSQSYSSHISDNILNHRHPNNGYSHNNNNDDSSRTNGEPQFVSIFERPAKQMQRNSNLTSASGQLNSAGGNLTNKEEDPYSLPANASSSDLKSSINEPYGVTHAIHNEHSDAGHQSARYQQMHMPSSASRYYDQQQQVSRRGQMYAGAINRLDSAYIEAQGNPNLRSRSKSNSNINRRPQDSKTRADRYNNSSSIYSPGHMLVPPPGQNDSKPPKLPPRDFGNKSKSKSYLNVAEGDELLGDNINPNEDIYSTGMLMVSKSSSSNNKVFKPKRNRFLESLKAPLELAKSNRSASVIGAPLTGATSNQKLHSAASSEVINADDLGKKAAGGRLAKSSTAKNFKSFLGVKSSKSKSNSKKGDPNASDDSNYVHVDIEGEHVNKNSGAKNIEQKLASEAAKVRNRRQILAAGAITGSNYKDLDIPTPDYETDENVAPIYATGNSGEQNTKATKNQQSMGGGNNNSTSANANNKKEDLYYSGFRAHGNSSNLTDPLASEAQLDESRQSIHHERSSLVSERVSRIDTKKRMNANTKMMLSSRFSSGGRPVDDLGNMIYASNYSDPSKSRYRSASMQRYYPSRVAIGSQQQRRAYDYDDINGCENPYGLSGILTHEDDYELHEHSGHLLDSVASHYAITGQQMRDRRPSSRLQMATTRRDLYAGPQSSASRLVSSSIANSNYDIGRSSSGIYGNNSSSSGSDYTDWQPQMRKVNSGGYLNSIFKANHLPGSKTNQPDTFIDSKRQNSIGSNKVNPSAYNNNNINANINVNSNQQQQQRNFGPSSDSEPSYTNSSDGLDIYVQIGAHSKLSRNHHSSHNQFLGVINATHNFAPEVHVGEWENMYDR